MEKQQEANCGDTDSMTTVTVKDYNSQMDYQEALPAYRPLKTAPMVQVAKIVAIAAVAIAGMLSFAIVFSAWLTNSSCQHQLQQLQKHQHLQQLTLAQQPQPSFEALIQPENLKNLLALGAGPVPSSLLRSKDDDEAKDLDSAESKRRGGDATDKNKIDEENNSSSSSSEEDEDNNNSAEDGVTMLKLPLELSFQDMFDRNHRSHMNCVIEKKKAEEIVDEQSKALPPLLGINMSTDPRYLHFTGEKMAISCDSGNDHPHAHPPHPRHHMPPPPSSPYHYSHHAPRGEAIEIPLMMDGLMGIPPSPRHHGHHQHQPIPMSFGRDSSSSPVQSLASAIAAASSSSVPIQIIGPIPLSSSSSGRDSSEPSGPAGLGLSAQMIPILVSGQGNSILEDLPISNQGNSERLSPLESLLLGPLFGQNGPSFSPQDLPPPPHHQHHVLHYQPISQSAPPPPPSQHAYHSSSSIEAQFAPFLQNPSSSSSSPYSHPFQSFSSLGAPSQIAPQSAEIRERAVPHPIPIMPRAHVQHVIRPRSVDALVKKRVKRCSCDCACKNHQE